MHKNLFFKKPRLATSLYIIYSPVLTIQNSFLLFQCFLLLG